MRFLNWCVSHTIFSKLRSYSNRWLEILPFLPSVHKERVFSHGDSLSPFAEQRKVACNSPITSFWRSGPMKTRVYQAFNKPKWSGMFTSLSHVVADLECIETLSTLFWHSLDIYWHMATGSVQATITFPFEQPTSIDIDLSITWSTKHRNCQRSLKHKVDPNISLEFFAFRLSAYLEIKHCILYHKSTLYVYMNRYMSHTCRFFSLLAGWLDSPTALPWNMHRAQRKPSDRCWCRIGGIEPLASACPRWMRIFVESV